MVFAEVMLNGEDWFSWRPLEEKSDVTQVLGRNGDGEMVRRWLDEAMEVMG